MRKADLVLHVETHKKHVIQCKKCDFMSLIKYLKGLLKCHSNELPYKCNLCNKSGVKAYKEKNTRINEILVNSNWQFIWRTPLYLVYITLSGVHVDTCIL